MSERQPIQDLMDAMAAELAERVSELAVARIRQEIEAQAKQSFVCFSEDEAAERLHCSPQTLAAKRKAGLIGSSLSPSGRPVYSPQHLQEYLARYELRAGSEPRRLRAVNR